jgi:NTP pyrophosphatase (non-canonical NTP hydrolase)
MMSADALRVTEGRIAVTRLYDLAYSIDLERVEREYSEATTRLRLTRAKPKAIFYARPPVDIALGHAQLQLTGGPVDVDVKARVYDFGAVRLSYELSVEALPWRDYVKLVDEAEAILDAPAPWEQDVARVRELIGSALTRPTQPGLEEDYVFAVVRGFDPPLPGEAATERLDLVPVLTGETRELSQAAREEILSQTFSYYSDDLVVISWSRALIVEPGGETDVADILGVAHAQLLELRYYNDHLDQELPLMYERIERLRSGFGALARRRYASLARSLHALFAEVTEVSERIENALVVTEDVYLAKVYDAALEQHRVRDWGVAVDRKLAIIRDTYTALYDEATAARAEYLELAIVLLIVLEIVMAFLM